MDTVTKTVFVQHMHFLKDKEIVDKVAHIARDIKERYPLEWLNALGITPKIKQAMTKSNTITHTDAFVLFLDTVHFTKLSTKMSSKELAEMMDTIYKDIDIVISRFGNTIFKVETIGDAYMAISLQSNLSTQERLNNILAFITGIAGVLRAFPENEKLQVRFGLNFGEISERNTGFDAIRRNFFGETVNIAARMESVSEPFKLRTTQSVFDHMPIRFRPRFVSQDIDVKGVGVMTTYITIDEI